MLALIIIACGFGPNTPGTLDGCALIFGSAPYRESSECERAYRLYEEAVRYGDVRLPLGGYLHGHICADIPMES